MGKLHISVNYLLGLLCASALAFPSLASAGNVSVDVSPTTGYTSTTSSTFAPPARSNVTAVQSYKPDLGPLAGGGAYQTMQSGITITGIKQESQTLASTVSSRLRATAGAMKNGLGRCFTSFRCNAALMVGSAGIETFLDGIGWIIEDGGRVRALPQPSPDTDQIFSGVYYVNNEQGGDIRYDTFSGALDYLNRGCPSGWYCNIPFIQRDNSSWCRLNASGAVIQCVFMVGSCPYQTGNFGCRDGNPPAAPLSPSDIRSGVDNSYTPDPSDLPFLASGGLDFSHDGVDIEIVDIPSVTGADSPNYIEYSDGTSKGTYSEYDFTWGAPSKQPEISVDERTVETTYSSTGEPTGTTTTTSSSSGSSSNNDGFDIPTDCDFMPTVCRFIDWFTEPDPELSQDADFSQLIDDVEIERDFSVGSSTASCPAPFVVHLKWVPSVEVSLQPFCDFVDLLRPVLLALAWLVSGMIVLRT